MKYCKHSRVLGNYSRGELSKDDASFIEQHLRTCSYCESSLRKDEHLSQLLSSFEEIEVPPALSKRTLECVFSAMDRKDTSFGFFSIESLMFAFRKPLYASVIILCFLIIPLLYYADLTKYDAQGLPAVSIADLRNNMQDIYGPDTELTGDFYSDREEREILEVLSKLNDDDELEYSSTARVFHSINYSSDKERQSTLVYLFSDGG